MWTSSHNIGENMSLLLISWACAEELFVTAEVCMSSEMSEKLHFPPFDGDKIRAVSKSCFQ